MKKHPFLNLTALLLCFSFTASPAFAQQIAERIFGFQHPFTVQDLPEGKLKTKLETLNPEAKANAMARMSQITFKAFDAAEHMRVDDKGGIFMVCPNEHGNCDGITHPPESIPASSEVAPVASTQTPGTGAASVSVNSPPAYSSKPGAPFHLYLDFNGATVAGKAWNTSYGVASWSCAAWSDDGDYTTFTDTEQAYMKQVWQRMAEDYAPFNINVTTDKAYDPITYAGDKNKVAWLLFTDEVDKNGKACPHNGAGGVAYLDVFGRADYFSTYQPAWVLPMAPADMAEAGSHEIGHNMGLSHDGTATQAYYGGHGSNDISWGPLMGTGYGRNVSQWSKGEYYKANQFQDDLSIISGKISYAADDHNSLAASATPLVVTGGTTITATTPETDPTNSSPQNKGIIEKHADIDMFSFQTGAGPVTLNVNPWKQTQVTGTYGGNLDVLMKLYDDQGTLVASANPEIQTRATITTTLAAGTYYLTVENSGAGTPSISTPTGYTDYGSLGQYFISGTIVTATPMLRVISVTPNVGDVNTTVSNVQITGTLFQATPTVSLKRTGYSDIVATNVTYIDPENLTCDFDLTGAALGLWNLSVTNPDLETASLPDAFTVELPTVDYYKEFFDASLSLPAGWTTYTTTLADPLWSVVTPYSQTINNSVFADTPAVISTKYIESPNIPIPADSINLKFSFWHDCDLERGYDGGILEFSIDGGEWFEVTSNNSGAAFESNGYNSVISSSYQSPIAGKYAWSGDSNGFIQTVVSIVDPAKYAGKTLKARWLLASDNFAVSTGWNIDTVELTGSTNPAAGGSGINDLAVAAATPLLFSGNYGSSFSPSSQTYTLTNNSLTSSLQWTASKNSSWVTLSPSSGSLEPGASATLTVSINSNAIALAVGDHTTTLTITNLSRLDDLMTRDVTVTVNPVPAIITLGSLNNVYSGTPKPVTVTTNPSGLTVTVTYDGSPTAPSTAGSYPVIATIVDLTYSGIATGTLVIAKKTPAVTTWPTAPSIFSNQPLSAATLSGGTASVPGSFTYDTPAALLSAGSRQVAVTFSPTDTVNYNTVTGTVSVTVYNPATVPAVVGLPQATAQSNMTVAFLLATITQSYSDTVASGLVISQSVAGGTTVIRGSSVGLVVSKGVEPSPKLVRTTVSAVSNTGWTTVNLGMTYTSPVIVATPIYTSSTLPPVVTRIRNVTTTSFDLMLDRVDGLAAAVSLNVAVVAVNEGVYTLAQHGVKMEAVKYTSTLTASGTGAWNAEARTYQNTYTKPVVVGQVMSYNDTRWSAFWSRGSKATAPITATSFNVGKHVGLDPAKTRANETIGYIVIESGTGTMNGVRYQAAVGTDIVRSFGDAVTPYKYTLSGFTSVSAAALSQTGMDGAEGSWAVLSGAPALTTTALKLHVAEDGFNNTLRKHTTEQVAFIVFE